MTWPPYFSIPFKIFAKLLSLIAHSSIIKVFTYNFSICLVSAKKLDKAYAILSEIFIYLKEKIFCAKRGDAKSGSTNSPLS